MTLNKPLQRYTTKLALMLSTIILCLSACTPIAKGESADMDLKHKFRGVNGAMMLLDAYPEHQYITINSETGRKIATPGSLAIKKDLLMGYSSTSYPVPKSIQVIWRSPNDGKAIWGKGGGIGYEGTIIGDYTVPVAERIPDVLLNDLRQNPRGNLRIKITPCR